MISFKKYLDQQPDKRLPLLLSAFQSALKAMGTESQQARPAVGTELRLGLDGLAVFLTEQITPLEIKQTGQQVEQELHQWGAATSAYFTQKTAEVKEMLMVMAHTAEAVGERDQRYSSRLEEFSGRLHTISRLDDLTEMRASLLLGAAELKDCVDRMVQDGEQSLAQLKAEVCTCRSRLEESERLTSRDALTGLYNRQKVEAILERRIARQELFSVALLDLENFEAVNHRFGQEVSDNLLKQFAYELRCSARPSDIVGRWDGDQFLVILDADLEETKAMLDRMQHWFTGEYSLPDATSASEVNLTANLGLAERQPGDTVPDVIARTSRALRQHKKNSAAPS